MKPIYYNGLKLIWDKKVKCWRTRQNDLNKTKLEIRVEKHLDKDPSIKYSKDSYCCRVSYYYDKLNSVSTISIEKSINISIKAALLRLKRCINDDIKYLNKKLFELKKEIENLNTIKDIL
jgi:hypothetical protein